MNHLVGVKRLLCWVVPGLFVAVLVKLTLKEPRLSRQVNIDTEQSPAIATVLKTLWQQRTFRHIFIAFCVSYFFSMGTSQWLSHLFYSQS